jgi:hypothetical protein
MTPRQHEAFASGIAMETSAVNAAVLMFNLLTRDIAAVNIACFLVVIGINVFGYSQVRAAKRQYERIIREHMDAGGTVMMIKHGKHWLPPVMVPRQAWRDGGGW